MQEQSAHSINSFQAPLSWNCCLPHDDSNTLVNLSFAILMPTPLVKCSSVSVKVSLTLHNGSPPPCPHSALANAPPPRHLALTFANINNRNNKTMDSVSNNIPSAKRRAQICDSHKSFVHTEKENFLSQIWANSCGSFFIHTLIV
jgi:hypothetical protein